MGVLLRHKVYTLFRPLSLTYEERAMYRWVLKIHGLPINNTHASSDILFIVRLEPIPNFRTSNVERRLQTWTPLEVKIVDTIYNEFQGVDDATIVEFLRGWMESDRKLDITLDKIDPTGVTQEKWQLYGSFIQEMHNEMVYDNTIGPITIRLNYDYATLIF